MFDTKLQLRRKRPSFASFFRALQDGTPRNVDPETLTGAKNSSTSLAPSRGRLDGT